MNYNPSGNAKEQMSMIKGTAYIEEFICWSMYIKVNPKQVPHLWSWATLEK